MSKKRYKEWKMDCIRDDDRSQMGQLMKNLSKKRIDDNQSGNIGIKR